jgi:hypothetical protein
MRIRESMRGLAVVGLVGATCGGGGSTDDAPYVVSSDDLTVTDTGTGLVWQRDGSGTRLNCVFDPYCTLAEAQTYCAGLTLGGTEWRLPTLVELESLVNTRFYPTINLTAFPSTPPDCFWTSTPYGAGSSELVPRACTVCFNDGEPSFDSVGGGDRVRCVHGGVPPGGGVSGGAPGSGSASGTGGTAGTDWSTCPTGSSTRFVVGTDALTVTDTCTGLAWQRDGSGTRAGCGTATSNLTCTWAEAQAYCSGLNLDGTGWRLPSLTELKSILDVTVASPSTINQTAFPNTPPACFWTSSPYAGSSGYAWYVLFSNGNSYFCGVGDNIRVRCVR